MSFPVIFNCFRHVNILTVPRVQFALQKNGYAVPGGMLGKMKKGKKAVGQAAGKIVLPVETDTKKLVSYVCGSNILKDGQDVEIKADSEYPDWLWNIRIGPPPKLEELDPNTKAYWRKLRKNALQRKNLYREYKKF